MITKFKSVRPSLNSNPHEFSHRVHSTGGPLIFTAVSTASPSTQKLRVEGFTEIDLKSRSFIILYEEGEDLSYSVRVNNLPAASSLQE